MACSISAVDVPHDRRLVADRAQVGHRRGGLGPQALGDLAEVVLLALEPVDDLAQLAAGDHDRPHDQAGGRADVVQRHDVTGVGDADGDLVVGEGDAEHAVPQHERHRDLGDRRRVDRVADQVDGADAVRVGRRLGQLRLGHDVVVDQNGPERAAGALGLLGRPVHRRRIGAALLERLEQRTECLIHEDPFCAASYASSVQNSRTLGLARTGTEDPSPLLRGSSGQNWPGDHYFPEVVAKGSHRSAFEPGP